jgi:hypothetical protein
MAKARDNIHGPERMLDLSGVPRRRHVETEQCGTGQTLTGSPSRAKTERIRPEAESARSREGVREARSTCEGVQDNTREGRALL